MPQEIISHPDYENLKSEIQALQNEINILILDRDDLLYHICKNIETEYMLKIGALEYKLFEQQCNILRLKRKIELIQSMINLQQPVVIAFIELQLDEEYKEYAQKLADKLNEINAALERNSSPVLSKEDAEDLKRLYAGIVKKVHPDLNPDIDKEWAEKYLSDAINAYKNGDLTALKAIHVLMIDVSGEFKIKGTLDELIEQRDTLFNRKERILKIIAEIKACFPCNQKEFLADEEKVKEKADELYRQLEEYKAIYNELDERIKRMVY